MRKMILFVVFHFVIFSAFADPPDWSVDPYGYDYSVNVVGRLYVNDVLDNNEGNIIAAFVKGEIRGVAIAQVFDGEAYYFLNIYSSDPAKDIVTFKVYLASEDNVLAIEESFRFNKIINGSTRSFHTYLDEDFPITLDNIPNQTVEKGIAFDSIYLPDYLNQTDDDPIVWTYSGNSNLQIEIIDEWLHVSPFDTTWLGTERLSIIATEQTTNGYAASKELDFIITQNSNPSGSENGEAPEWNINPSDYMFDTDLTAQFYINDQLEHSTGNVIAAFVNDTVRGVAEGTIIGDQVYYFIKVYSSYPSQDEFNFKVYVSGEDDVFDIEETLEYNEINLGTVYELNSYLDIDQQITLDSILDQTQVEGFEFDSIYLPDYLIQVDDDPVQWSLAGNTEIQMLINQDWLLVESITEAWTGTEAITIIATEQTPNNYADTIVVNYTVIPDYGAPSWDEVPDQKIGLNQTFKAFDLTESIFPYSGNSLAYDYFMPQSNGTDLDEAWSFSDKDFQYSMSITTSVKYGTTDHAGSGDKLYAFINEELVGIASPTETNGKIIYFLGVYSNDNNSTVNFKLFDQAHSKLYEISEELTFQNGAENGTPDNPLNFNTAPLEVLLENDGNVIVNIENTGWIGTQQIAFIGYDTFQPLINADTTYADFTVLNEYAPEVSGIADQYVEQGSLFSNIDLKAHYSEYDGDTIVWSVIGAEQLNFNINAKDILSISPIDTTWAGEEIVKIRITDMTACGLFSEQEVSFTIGAPNQAPEIFMIPDQIIGIGDTFPNLDLEDYFIEPNGDPVTWSYFYKNQNLESSDPAWNINPGVFQFSMTMTARVKVREDFPAAEGHQLAAFFEGELRGLSSAQEVDGNWMFFINIYANQSQDSIYFQYFDPDQNAVYAIDDSVKFISQQQIGSVNSPFDLYAGFVDPLPIGALLSPHLIDKDWIGSDTLYAIVTESGTYERYKDTAQIVFTVQATGPNLPVDLIAFTGKAESGKSILNWEVSNPDNIQAYEIQRAIDRQGASTLNWSSIGVESHEEEKSFYQFIDEQPYFRKNYYRLKMIDYDGSYEYSDIVSLDFEKSNSYKARLYPNPSTNRTIYLDVITAEVEEMEIQIVDNSGRNWMMLKTQTQGNREFLALDLENYPPGNYFARIKINHNLQVLSFSVVRD